MSTSWPDGVGRRVLDSVDSTNAEAARRAPDALQPEWILGLSQTAGRGRRGRAWADPVGNFSATYLSKPIETAEVVALRSFVAALAVFDAVVTLSGRADGLALKWPNDVLLNGGKLAGILLESTGVGKSITYLAVGIGVNLVHTPRHETLETGAVPPVSLADQTGVQVTPQEFLDVLAPAFHKWEQMLKRDGFDPLRKVWLTRAARLGQVITARTGNAEMQGTFETVDAKGNLVLLSAKGRHTIPAADVFF